MLPGNGMVKKRLLSQWRRSVACSFVAYGGVAQTSQYGLLCP